MLHLHSDKLQMIKQRKNTCFVHLQTVYIFCETCDLMWFTQWISEVRLFASWRPVAVRHV